MQDGDLVPPMALRQHTAVELLLLTLTYFPLICELKDLNAK